MQNFCFAASVGWQQLSYGVMVTIYCIHPFCMGSSSIGQYHANHIVGIVTFLGEHMTSSQVDLLEWAIPLDVILALWVEDGLVHFF